MAKTGESYEMAARNIRAQEPTNAPVRSPLHDLLAQLRVTNTFGVVTGRTPAVAASATLAVAVRQAEQLASHPTWYAKSGAVEMTVTFDQHRQLIADGAADDTMLQMIRSHRTEQHLTFSERCHDCNRWIWCAEAEREAACVCGHMYRVVFDLAGPTQWTLRHNARCMDCGAERVMSQPHEGLNPWHAVNAWQAQCNICYRKAPVETNAYVYDSMTLKPGLQKADGGNTAWSFVDANDKPVKQFFVAYGGFTPITLDITMILGARLTDDELQQVHDEVQRQNPSREVVWRHTLLSPVDDVIETLMKACGALGIAPPRPFSTVQDFQAWILEQYASFHAAQQPQQREWILKAVVEAEAHRVGGVVECIKRVRMLDESPSGGS